MVEFAKVPGFDVQVWQIFNVAMFQFGDLVNVSGITKVEDFQE